MSQFFTSGCQSIGVSASVSVLQMNIQDWFPLGWTGWISLQSKGLSRVFSNTTVQKHQFFGVQLFFIVQLSHPYMTTGKIIALTRRTFVGKVMSLLCNMLFRLVITFFSRGNILNPFNNGVTLGQHILSCKVSFGWPSFVSAATGPILCSFYEHTKNYNVFLF